MTRTCTEPRSPLGDLEVTEQIYKMRTERDAALLSGVARAKRLKERNETTWDTTEKLFMSTMEKYSSLFCGNHKWETLWNPDNGELVTLMNQSIDALDGKAAFPVWGPSSSSSEPLAYNENAERDEAERALVKQKYYQELALANFDKRMRVAKANAELNEQRVKKVIAKKLHRQKQQKQASRLATPPASNEPVDKPSPVRPGEKGSIDFAASLQLAEPPWTTAPAQPPRRKALTELSDNVASDEDIDFTPPSMRIFDLGRQE
jgi:hypothetical protein